MMNLGCRNNLSTLFTLLTKRVRRDVLVTNPFPSPAVPFLGFGVTVVHLIALHLELLVFFAKAFIGQPRASGIGTGAFWFFRHRAHLISGHEKPIFIYACVELMC